jgi:hypothetical protein
VIAALACARPAVAHDPDDAADTDDEQAPETAEPAPPENPLERVQRDALERDLSRVLADKKLAFCNGEWSAKAYADPKLCRLAKAQAHQRCPALVHACEGAPPPSARPEPEHERAPERDTASASAPGLALLGSVLFWGAVALLVVGLLRLLLPFLRGLRRGSDPAPPASTPASTPEREQAPRVAGETDVERLLARAERASAGGRFDEAISAAYAALVHWLGQHELVSVDPSRTNGDYLRELSPRPELQREIRQVFRSVESVQFGRSQPSAALFSELFARVLPIVKRGAALCALLWLGHAASGCSAPSARSSENGPMGLELLSALLSENGTQVKRRIKNLDSLDANVVQILVVNDELEPEAWDKLLAWTNDGGSLVVSGPSPEAGKRSKVALAYDACQGKLEPAQRYQSTKLELVDPSSRSLHVSERAQPAEVAVSCDGQPRIAVVPYGDGEITLVADPDFLGNASLSVGDNAYFALGLLNRPGSTLELVGGWTAAGVDSPFTAIKNAGLRPALLELLAFAAILIWHYGAAFGLRRDPASATRRAFVDHVRALGQSYARAKARRFALGAYGAYALERLRERLGRGRPLGLIELSAELAERTGERERDLVLLFTDAHDARDTAELVPGEPADITSIQKLESLISRFGGTSERR